MESLVLLCITNKIKTGQELLLDQLSKRVADELISIKQLLITEAILVWAMKYSEWLDKSWRAVLNVISRFSRRKAIVKGK
jgi:hypothetical protein